MNIKRKVVTKDEAAGIAQQAAWSASLSASVSWLTASRPGGYFDDSAAVSTVRSCLNRTATLFWSSNVALNCQVVMNGLVALTGRFSVLTSRRRSGAQRRVLVPGRSSWCPDGRCRCPVCHSASSIYSSRSTCSVRLPPIDYIRAVSSSKSWAS